MSLFQTQINRRRLIRDGAVGTLGIMGGLSLSLKAFAAEPYDLIIIGAGTAGIPCAIFAADAGARVLMIEKSDMVGGTLWLTGGSMAAAGTRVQARLGIKDSPDFHYEDIMRLGHGKGVPEVIRRYVDNAAPMVDWLDDIGFKVRAGEPVAGRAGGHAAFSIARYFQGAERGRSVVKVLLPVLRKHVDSGRVRILLKTGAEELVVDRGKDVRGVIAAGQDGVRTQFSARKVVITTGGYCHNPVMFKRVTGLESYVRSAYSMAKGEGLLLGEAAGGFIRGGQNQILAPAILNDRDYPSVGTAKWLALDQNYRPQWEIRVNNQGKRFVREDVLDRDISDRALTEQPQQKMWVLFNQEVFDKAPLVAVGRDKDEFTALFNTHPMYMREPTIEVLAARAGIHPQNLKRTVDDYNQAVRIKSDTQLGREFLPCEMNAGPYYAVEMCGTNLVGFGGLAVNANLQVLRQDGSSIGNLHAAGEVIGLSTIAGDVVVGGTGVTPSLTFGRYIGKNIMAWA